MGCVNTKTLNTLECRCSLGKKSALYAVCFYFHLVSPFLGTEFILFIFGIEVFGNFHFIFH